MVISDEGEIIENFCRVSWGWKALNADPNFYHEGSGFSTFTYKGKTFTTAICGYLWDEANLVAIEDLQVDCVLWPCYVDFSINKWERGEKEEYAFCVKDILAPTFLINSYVEDEQKAKGGCFVFSGNIILQELSPGRLGIITAEI